MTFLATRLVDTPIITPTIHPILIEEAQKYGYTNINGPSLIKVPDWVSNKLGTYYLYFAHHKGPFIRMAYADTLTGPWTMYDKEIMPLAAAEDMENPRFWCKSSSFLLCSSFRNFNINSTYSYS